MSHGPVPVGDMRDASDDRLAAGIDVNVFDSYGLLPAPIARSPARKHFGPAFFVRCRRNKLRSSI